MAILDVEEAVVTTEGALAGAVVPLRLQIQHMQMLMDSTAPGEPMGDMRRFLAAEYARDSLGARPLAVATFASIPQGWPQSPYAAKAWLAARQLTGDTLDAGGEFHGSPYMAVLRGEEGGDYAQLEDSLATFARTLAAASTPKPTPGGRHDAPTVPSTRTTTIPRPCAVAPSSVRARQPPPGARRVPPRARPGSSGGRSGGLRHAVPESDPPRRRHRRLWSRTRRGDGAVPPRRPGHQGRSLAPRAGNAPPRVAEYPGGMSTRSGLANPGLAAVRSDHLPWLVRSAPPARVIVNVVGFEIGNMPRSSRASSRSRESPPGN